MSKALTPVDLNKYLTGKLDQIGKWCSGIDPSSLMRIAVRDLANPDKAKRLSQCSPSSIYLSLTYAAQLGLDPSGVGGQGYLVPYKGECTFQPGYRGLIKLALESGHVKSIWAAVAYEKDEFTVYRGTDPKIYHRPVIEDRGNPIAVYAVAKLASGDVQFEVMSFKQVDDIREGSAGKNLAPWKKHWEEMAKKTVIKRLCKYLGSGRLLNQAVAIDNAVEFSSNPHGISQSALERDDYIELPATEASKSGLSRLKAKVAESTDWTGEDPGSEELDSRVSPEDIEVGL